MIITHNNITIYTANEEFNIPGTLIHKKAKIGKNCKIHFPVWIAEGVVIDEGSTVGAFTFIPNGVRIGKNVFIGPHVTFTNDKHPPSKGKGWLPIIVEDNVSIGASASILAGVILGEGCKVGMGAVVIREVPPGRLVLGNPARFPKPIDKTLDSVQPGG